MARSPWNHDSASDPHGSSWEETRVDESTSLPHAGAYVTDGAALFRVEHLADGVDGELLIELENCDTLELVLCPAKTLAALGLRTVTPTLYR
jgi:hypothetical protein